MMQAEHRREVWVQWAVYFNPLDFPDKWVVRKYHVLEGRVEPQAEHYVGDSQAEVENQIPERRSLVWMNRMSQDHPSVVGTWL